MRMPLLSGFIVRYSISVLIAILPTLSFAVDDVKFIEVPDKEEDASLIFVTKVLDVWKRRFNFLADSIIQHPITDNISLRKKTRSRSVRRAFIESGNINILRDFLESSRQGLSAIENTVRSDGLASDVDEFYLDTIQPFMFATFIGAEWIVVSAYLQKRILDENTKRANKLFRPAYMGYKLKKQSNEKRGQIRLICKEAKTDFINTKFDFSPADPPKTVAEFEQRKRQILLHSQNALRLAVDKCQQDIDALILPEQGDAKFLYAKAASIERQTQLSEEKLRSIYFHYERERTAMKALFIDRVSKSKNGALNDSATESLSVSDFISEYKEALEAVNQKYVSIDQLQRLLDKYIDRIKNADFNYAAERFFQKHKEDFYYEDLSELKETMRSAVQRKLRNQHVNWQEEILQKQIATAKEVNNFQSIVDKQKIQLEKLAAESLLLIETGGITINKWESLLKKLVAQINDRFDEIINDDKTLKKYNADAQGYDTARAVIAYLKTQRRNFNYDYSRLKDAFLRGLSYGNITGFKDLFDTYLGKAIDDSARAYAAKNTSKFEKLFLGYLYKIYESSALVHLSSATNQRRELLNNALLSLFSDYSDENIDTINAYLVQLEVNRNMLLNSREYPAQVATLIMQQEEKTLSPLIAMIIEKITRNVDFNGIIKLSLSANQLEILIRFTTYFHTVHNTNNVLVLRNFLERALQTGAANNFPIQTRNKFIRELTGPLPWAALTRSHIGLEIEEQEADLGFIGIPNLGNTCFANVCLQALTHLSIWANQGEPRPLHSRMPVIEPAAHLQGRIEDISEAIRQKNIDNLNSHLKEFFDLAYKILPCLKDKQPGLEQDAQEFWIDLMELLGVDEKDFPLPIRFQSSNFIKNHARSKEGDYTNPQVMHLLTLPIIGQRTSIKKAIKAWGKAESYEREGSQKMYNQSLLHDSPDILVVGVNRFDAENQKLDTPLAVSDFRLRFHRYGDEDGLEAYTKIPYRLVGGIYHSGETTNSGHYYWVDHINNLKYSDTKITPLTVQDHALEKESYLLFFEKVRL